MDKTDKSLDTRRGMSLELKTSLTIAAVLAAMFLVFWGIVGIGPPGELAIGMALVFVVVVSILDLWVYRPLGKLIKSSQGRLGHKYENADPAYRDQIDELGYLLQTLISVFTSAESNETATRSIREDLVRLQTFNRQLVEVGEIGNDINAALPYRETVDRALTRVKTFLQADFVALLMLDPETRQFEIQGTFGVKSRSLDPACCAYTPDCPVRKAVNGKGVVRSIDHACSLFPTTMKSQVIVPISAENTGDMALLATATSRTNFDRVTEDVLHNLQAHLQSAISNGRKYDGIRRQVVTDHLTGLYNRRYFMNRAVEELELSLKTQTPMSIVMLDIDHFKNVNDTYGHSTGDQVLQQVSQIMLEAVRTADICARHGGEEFVMLLPNTPGDNAAFMADRLRRTVGEWRYTGLGLPKDVSVTVSSGVATCPRDATTVDELLELADKALYRAKADGRNRVCQYGVDESLPN